MGPFDRFNDRAKRVLALAQDEAIRFNHNYIGTEHLLLGLVREGEGVAAHVLDSLGVELSKLRVSVEHIIGRGQERTAPSDITLSPRTKKIIELAIDEARKLGHQHVGTEHLLLGLVREGEGIASNVLASLGVPLEKVRYQVIATLGQGGGEVPRVPAGARWTTIGQPYARGPFENFTEDAQRVLLAAQNCAIMDRHQAIGAEHLLYAIAYLGHGVAGEVLCSLVGHVGLLRDAVREVNAAHLRDQQEGAVVLGESASAALLRSQLLADRFGGTRTGTEHILIEILRDPGAAALAVLEKCGVARAKLRDDLLQRLGLSDLPG